MSIYCSLSDNRDPLLKLESKDLDEVDAFINSLLSSRGIDPTLITLPNQLLSNIGIHFALLKVGARLMATGQDSAYEAKIKLYERILDREIGQVNSSLFTAGSSTQRVYSIPLLRA